MTNAELFALTPERGLMRSVLLTGRVRGWIRTDAPTEIRRRAGNGAALLADAASYLCRVTWTNLFRLRPVPVPSFQPTSMA